MIVGLLCHLASKCSHFKLLFALHTGTAIISQNYSFLSGVRKSFAPSPWYEKSTSKINGNEKSGKPQTGIVVK